MPDRYKPSESEVRDLARESENQISKDTIVVNNTDGSRCASVTNIPGHGITVVHDHNSGQTYVEDNS